MVNLLEAILSSIFAEGLQWYRSTVLEGFTRFPYFFLSILLTYIFIQLFCHFIPPLRKLLLVLALPFRYMHVWLHIDAAKKINMQDKAAKENKHTSINLWTSLRGKDSTHIFLEAYSTQNALKIASAPLKGAIALLLFIVLSSPILARLGLFGILFHIYLIFSCFGVAWPSFSDYSFVYQGAMIHTESLSPGYFLWMYFIFAISGYIALERTGSAISAIMEGLAFSCIYIVGLLFLAKIITPKNDTNEKKLHFFVRNN